MMSRHVRIDLASTGGARGGKLALDLAAESDSPATAAIARILARWPAHPDPGELLPMLHAVQDELGYIPEDSVALIAATMSRSRAEIHGVITFYPYFRLHPVQGRHLEICRAEACQARGATQLIEHAARQMGLPMGECSADGAVTTTPVYCLGLCAQGPAIMLDGRPHAHVTPARLASLLAEAPDREVA